MYTLSYHVIKARRAHRRLSETSADSEDIRYEREAASSTEHAYDKASVLRPRPARKAEEVGGEGMFHLS